MKREIQQFIDAYGGRYLPKKHTRQERDRMIRNTFDELLLRGIPSESAYKMLAAEYELCPRQIRRICKHGMIENILST
jgi:hypothetical protein